LFSTLNLLAFGAWLKSSILEHAAKVNNHLRVNIFVVRALKYFCFRAQSHRELSVVLFLYRSCSFKEVEYVNPTNVVTHWVGINNGKGV